jgi:hypothetical protein
MATATTTVPDLRKGTKVVATADLRDVPEGTKGKVILVDGFTWIRYWVRFDNGVALGSIPRSKLATPAELKARAERGDEDEAEADEAGGDDGGAADDGDGGGVTTASGTFVPQKFIERAAAARARLAG